MQKVLLRSHFHSCIPIPALSLPAHACLQVAEDYRFDYKLYSLCKDDVKNLCDDVEPGEGLEMECLVSGWMGHY